MTEYKDKGYLSFFNLTKKSLPFVLKSKFMFDKDIKLSSNKLKTTPLSVFKESIFFKMYFA